MQCVSRTVLKTNMQEIMQGGPTADLDRRIRFMTDRQHNEGMTVIDKEAEDISNIATPIGGVSEIVQQALEYVAAINRTPVVKLLGLSPSGFNATGESDIRNYYDHILSQNELIFRKGIKKALDILQVVEFGEIDPDIDFEFKRLWTMDDVQQSEIDNKYITGLLSLHESQIISAEVVVSELKARKVFKGDVRAEGLELEAGGEGEIQWEKLVPSAKDNEDGADSLTA